MDDNERFGLIEKIEDIIGAAAIVVAFWAGIYLAGGLGGVAGVSP